MVRSSVAAGGTVAGRGGASAARRGSFGGRSQARQSPGVACPRDLVAAHQGDRTSLQADDEGAEDLAEVADHGRRASPTSGAARPTTWL